MFYKYSFFRFFFVFFFEFRWPFLLSWLFFRCRGSLYSLIGLVCLKILFFINFFCCFLSKFISLSGPICPTITSTISVPFSVVIIWFLNVWFFFFPESDFFCFWGSSGLALFCFVLSTINSRSVKISCIHKYSFSFFWNCYNQLGGNIWGKILLQ